MAQSKKSNPVKRFFRKVILAVASFAAFVSFTFIIYETVWIPGHFNELTSIFKIDEKLSFNHAEVQQKYAQLKQDYPDFAGNFMVNGLGMNFPVTQCDDNTYYLKHTIDGKLDKHGALFVDTKNNLNELDDNTIIYGHNMKDSTQFGMLNMYKTVDGYKLGPVVTFNTLYKDYKWKVFACFLINTEPEDDNGYFFNYTKRDFEGNKEFRAFYNEAMERSYIKTGVDVRYGDKILTMSTCSTLFDDSRLVVMARLVRDGESAEVNTAVACQNTNQRFPAVYKDH